MAARVDDVVRLADGRRLAYCEWGVPGGRPVVFCNGSPGSRLWCPDEDAVGEHGVRLVTFDRPGTGRSDALAGRTLAHVAADVAALGDALGIDRFGVVGYSAGGTAAAACAALVPGRLDGVAIVSCRHLGAYDTDERPEALDELDEESRAVWELGRSDPAAAAALAAEQDAAWVQELLERPDAIWDGPAEERAPEGDRWFWRDAERTAAFYADQTEGLRQGVEGYCWESIDVLLPWGFRLDEIRVPVTIWYGEQDARFQGRGLEMLRWAAGRIPSSRVRAWPDAGHMGITKHFGAVLAGLARDGG